jgi:hypothetical protein
LEISNWQRIKVLMLMAFIFGALAPMANAVTYNWQGAANTEGYWTNGANWDRGVSPTWTDAVYIANGGTAVVDIAESCSNLYLGNSGSSGGGLIITNNAAFSNRVFYLGCSSSAGGDGTVIQHSGIVTGDVAAGSYAIFLGFTAGRYGRYLMNGGWLTMPGYLLVGYKGIGEMYVNNGTVNANNGL